MSRFRKHPILNGQSFLLLVFYFLFLAPIFTQDLEVEGQVKITEMEENNSDSAVVLLPDGILGIRNISDFTEFQILSINEDTMFLTNGGYVVLPDPDTTNEIQQLEVSEEGDTLYLSESNWVIVPGISNANPKPLDASNAATAMEMTGVESAVWVLPDGSQPPDTSTFKLGYGILSSFGSNVNPQAGADFVVISTGAARTPSDIGYVDNLKKGYVNNHPTGFPVNVLNCLGPCPTPSTDAFDGVALKVTLTSPGNATGFSFDWKFYSQDYPDWLCTEYLDQVAVYINPVPMGLSSDNIIIDASNNPLTARYQLEVCQPSSCYTCPLGTSELLGTGFEGHAATPWYSSNSTGGPYPCLPNTTYVITFAIWDSGDENLSSTLLLDNWEWLSD